MIVKPPPAWYSIYPLRFARPSVVNDTPQAWAKLEQDYRKFLRELQEAVQCFGADRVERDLHDILKGRQGNTPDEERNTLILAEYDLRARKGRVNKSELARDLARPHEQPKSVRRQLLRLLEAREQQAKRKAQGDREFQEALQRLGKTLLGSVTK
jgi:hypothetical protein